MAEGSEGGSRALHAVSHRKSSSAKRPCAPHPQRVKCLVETVFPARGAQLAQENRWQYAPFLDRDDHLEQILPVGLNQVPVNDVVVKEGIDMLVDDLFGGAIEPEVLPVADAWHQLNPQ